MARDGSGVYSKASGTTAVPNTPIESAKFNSAIDDIAADLNYPRPITAGGTGSTSAAAARVALGLDAAQSYAVKSGNYTAVLTDNNAFHNFTGATPTLSLTAAATLGANWHYDGYAVGGPVIIDPSGAELINGAATVTVPQYCTFSIKCDGSAFVCVTVSQFSPSAYDTRYAIVNDAAAATPVFKTGLLDFWAAAANAAIRFIDDLGVQKATIQWNRVLNRLRFFHQDQLSTPLSHDGADGIWRIAENPVHHDGIAGRCMAYINFNGTGTIAIRKSFNVASIVDNGVGDYTINFTTPMPDANYIVVINSKRGGSTEPTASYVQSKTTSALNIRTGVGSFAFVDSDDVNIAVYG